MRITNFCLAALASSALLFAAGCATPGAPLPPSLNLPRPVEDLKAERKGERVLLTWSKPAETTDRQTITRFGITRVCRDFQKFPIESCAITVKQLPASELQTGSAEQSTLLFEDVLPAGSLDPSGFATYAIEVQNPRGRSAGLSNQVRVSLAPTLTPPTQVNAEVGADQIRISWEEPQRESAPLGLKFSYRVSRRIAGQGEYTVLDDVPFAGRAGLFLDRSFDWEKTYEYRVTPTTEVPGPRGAIEINGEDSPALKVFAHDVFPPERPKSVEAVFSGVGQQPFIDVTWAPNTELDLAGYNVYRRQGNGEARQINREVVKSPSFRDESVQAGVTYFYSVAAVDLRGNQSARSAETSEFVPKQ
jgi:hypothetical protein